MAITLEAIRAAGGIVHSDGNIFFRDISMLQGLAGAAPAAVEGPAYSLDADPDGIRARAADAIKDALARGFQNGEAPPAGHWLELFWRQARFSTIQYNALRDSAEALLDAPALEAPAAPVCERCGLSPAEHNPTHWCDNQSFAAAAPQAPAATVDPVPVDPADALRWGANVAETLLRIGESIGFGRAQQILGEQWEAKHDCAPRGRMGVTVKDDRPAAPQAPAAPSPYSADLLATLGQWHQRCEVMGAHHTLTETQIAELVVAGLLRRAHGGQVITTAGRAALAAPAAPAADASDTARMDWLEKQVVNVRAPLRYGSRDMFWASPEEVDGGPEGPSDLRARIDAAQAAAKVSP